MSYLEWGFPVYYDLPRVELSFSCARRRSTHAPVHPIRTATLQLWFGELCWPLRRPVVHQTHAVFSFQNVFRNSSSISVASDGMQMGHGSHGHHSVHRIRRSNRDWNEKMEERGELVALVSLFYNSHLTTMAKPAKLSPPSTPSSPRHARRHFRRSQCHASHFWAESRAASELLMPLAFRSSPLRHRLSLIVSF